MLLRLIIPFILLFFLACDGTKESVSASSDDKKTVIGYVADGYITGALVCLDINNNAECEDDEPQTSSDSNGRYRFDVDEDELDEFPITVEVLEGATDSDSGAITQTFVMQAPAGATQFVSPLTTLIKAEMDDDETLDLEDAESRIQNAMGLTGDVDLLANFMIEKETNSDYETIHESAQVIANLIQATTATSTANSEQTLKAAVASITPKLSVITTQLEQNQSVETVVAANIPETNTTSNDSSSTTTTNSKYTMTAAPAVVNCSTLNSELGANAVSALTSKGFDKCALVFGFLIANSITNPQATPYKAPYDATYWVQLTANIMAEILDNDQDGIADDTKVVDYMQSKNRGGWMPILRASYEQDDSNYANINALLGSDTSMKESWFKDAGSETATDGGARGIIAQEAIHNWQNSGLAKAYPAEFGFTDAGCSADDENSAKGCTFNDSIMTKSAYEAMTISSPRWYGQSPSGNVYDASKGYNIGDCTKPNCAAVEYYYNILTAYRAKGLWTNDAGKDPFDFPANSSEVKTKLNATQKGKALLQILDNPAYHQLINGITFSYSPSNTSSSSNGDLPSNIF